MIGMDIQRCRSMLRKAAPTNAGWDSISAELFALILKSVQKIADTEPSEARRIVAIAGVCSRWRSLVQQIHASAPLGLLQFPSSLRQQPGPAVSGPIRCLLVRAPRRSFLLFQQSAGNGNLHFLMAARRQWKPLIAGGGSFTIAASRSSLSESGHAFMGTVSSDFWGADFKVWENAAGAGRSRHRQLAAAVRYSDSLHHGRRLRAMECHVIAPGSVSVSVSNIRHYPSTFSLGCFSGEQKSSVVSPSVSGGPASCFRSYSNRSRVASACPSPPESENLRQEAQPVVQKMESKVPDWDQNSRCWSLNFHGRSSLPSVYSFQLVSPATDSGNDAGSTVFLQLGKVGKGLYTVDFRHPLSAFQAFAICLTSFATKVGIDP